MLTFDLSACVDDPHRAECFETCKVENESKEETCNTREGKWLSNELKIQWCLIEPVELMCDPNELDNLERECIDTCLTDADRFSLYGCIASCQTTKTETEAKCNSQKGKN